MSLSVFPGRDGDGKHQVGRAAQRTDGFQYVQRCVGERYSMLGAALHPGRRDAPLVSLQVDLGPGCAPRLARAAGGKHDEPQTRLRGHQRPGRCDDSERRGHLVVGQRPEVRLDGRQGRQRAVDGLAGEVVLDVAVRLRPSQRRADALSNLAADLGLGGPDGRQDAQDIFTADLVDAPIAEDGRRS